MIGNRAESGVEGVEEIMGVVGNIIHGPVGVRGGRVGWGAGWDIRVGKLKVSGVIWDNVSYLNH